MEQFDYLEYLALLGAGTVSINRVSGGGKPRVTREEVLGALATLPDVYVEFAYALVDAAGNRVLDDLMYWAHRQVVTVEKHADVKFGDFCSCWRVAWSNCLCDGLCKACKGTGLVEGRVCDECGGKGRHVHGDSERALIRQLGCSRARVQALRPVYTDCVGLILDAMQRIRGRLMFHFMAVA